MEERIPEFNLINCLTTSSKPEKKNNPLIVTVLVPQPLHRDDDNSTMRQNF